MRMYPVIVCLLVAACGSVKEDNNPDGPPPGDGNNGDTPPPPPMPRLHLKMDDPVVGDGALDSAGSHVTSCTTDAECPQLVIGQIAGAYQFGGNRLTVAPATDLAPGTGYTLALWARVEQAPDPAIGNAIIAAKNFNDLNSSYALSVSPGLKPQFFSLSDASQNLDASVTLSFNTWHHLAATWNGSQKVIYVDGAPSGSGPATSMPNNPNLGMTIGQRPSTSSPLSFTGSVDELMMFDRALSDAEVAMLAKP